ncbi:hypothetical protein JMJ35_002846 [Cladonia borealis]|uniref:AB hydrolase-1 domain-containing protein n=1 Tax=Cladonia borealis TaxID=184061 RepID=A0AA39V6I2_9LECA|nr:hypothetical protein JMJ35_002846 [Cladonia borealis]
MSAVFSVTEHILPGQHIRGYPYGVKSEPAKLRLAIKEYRPLDNIDAAPGSVTIIAAHANGLVKETYEPLWDELHRAFPGKIRAIWIADVSNQGASGVLNEYIQGDDTNWFDHSRDLLRMVNHFEERMPRPIVGISHSIGTAHLVQLSLLHPRLFHGLALIESIIQEGHTGNAPNVAGSSSLRRDLFPSRTAAEQSFRKNKFYQSWDSRALDKYLEYGLRETPTLLYPEAPNGSVTLTTTKHQEVWSFIRSNFISMPNDRQARLMSPDLSEENRTYLFHRPEMAMTFESLPKVRPNVLWVFGGLSPLSPEKFQDEKVARTGTGVGGNGGVNAGSVEKVVVEDGGHMLPFEKIEKCAAILASWLEKQMEDFEAVEKFYREHPSGRSERNMLAVSKLWLDNVRLEPRTKRSDKSKL